MSNVHAEAIQQTRPKSVQDLGPRHNNVSVTIRSIQRVQVLEGHHMPCTVGPQREHNRAGQHISTFGPLLCPTHYKSHQMQTQRFHISNIRQEARILEH